MFTDRQACEGEGAEGFIEGEEFGFDGGLVRGGDSFPSVHTG